MDNLFAAIDEYTHPLDFEFRVIDKREKVYISGRYMPGIFDLGAQTLTYIDETEMSRITKMLMNLSYDLDQFNEED